MKIISGGQTGVDQIALLVAKELGFETGGYAPKNFLTENGLMVELLKGFGLQELDTNSYSARTRKNIEESDITLVFSVELNSPGTLLTINTCKKLGKKCIINPTSLDVDNKINIINIAGTRGSKLSNREEEKIKTAITECLSKYLHPEK